MNEDLGDRGEVIVPQVEDNLNLQHVIRERKAERKRKAKEKQQADLQRIRDMRSTTGIHPLEQFPKEIWVKIFDELDPKDRKNVWEVHPLFRDLLEETRARDVLAEVFQLDAFHETVSPTRPIHRRRLQGKLRSISKYTSNSHDRWVENSLRKRIIENQAYSRINDPNTVNLHFKYTDECRLLKELLASYVEGEETESGKLFFPRALTVSFFDALGVGDLDADEVSEMINQFDADVTALLQRIGSQVWHFRFFVEEPRSDAVNFSFSDMYIVFQRWISFMPNISWLEVMIRPPYQMIDETKGRRQILTAESAVRRHPFPHLNFLERLSFHSIYQPGEVKRFLNIYEIILGANQHITMLDLTDGAEVYRTDILMPPHLTQSLQLIRFTVSDWPDSEHDSFSYLVCVQPILNFNWPLQTIVLDLQGGGEPGIDSIGQVLRVLTHFPTLEKVKLHLLEDFSVGDTEEFGYLENYNLKEFELELYMPKIYYDSNIHFFFSLQFLVHCAKLKRLSWKLSQFCDEELGANLKRYEYLKHGETIDFRAGLRCLYDSNIWHVFPRLDVIDVELRIYEQDEFCQHEYRREDVGSMTAKQFRKIHQCNRLNLDGACVL